MHPGELQERRDWSPPFDDQFQCWLALPFEHSILHNHSPVSPIADRPHTGDAYIGMHRHTSASPATARSWPNQHASSIMHTHSSASPATIAAGRSQALDEPMPLPVCSNLSDSDGTKLPAAMRASGSTYLLGESARDRVGGARGVGLRSTNVTCAKMAFDLLSRPTAAFNFSKRHL